MRDEHLYPIIDSVLFLSGDRDALCDLKLLKKVVPKMKKARLYIVADGDHSFKVRKKSGLDQDQVFVDCVKEIKKFVR